MKPTKIVCDKCKGLGVAKYGSVLGWGIATPNMPCRHCLGKGRVEAQKNTLEVIDTA